MTISPQFQRALEVLSDGEWHNYREVVSKMASVIPPGIGARRAEANRKGTAKRNGWKSVDRRVHRRNSVELARIGALAMARQTLQNPRRFEIEPRGVTTRGVERKVRLRQPEGAE